MDIVKNASQTNKQNSLYNARDMVSLLDIRPSYGARTGCNGDHVDDKIKNTKDRVSNNLHPLCFHQRGLTKMQIKKITVKTLIIIALV